MKNNIPSLNGLRALSITAVIVGHIQNRVLHNAKLPFPLDYIFDANQGVNVFFVISGFLITTLLLDEEKESGTNDLKSFYIRRIFRIFPAYYFLLIVYAILQMSSVIHLSARSWLSSIFYYKYLDGLDWESGHFWSLSVEEHFYLIWPLVFMLGKRIRAWFAYFVILAVIFFHFNSYVRIFNLPVCDNFLSIFQRGDAIMIGCLLALKKDQFAPWVVRIYSSRMSVILIFVILCLVGDRHIIDWNMKYHLHLGFLLTPLWFGDNLGVVANFMIGLLVLASIADRGLWFKFLNLPVMNYIGKLSYSLYLWQQLFFSKQLGSLSRPPLNLVCIAACALFSYYVIEKPALKIRDFYMAKMKSRKSAIVVSQLA